MDPWVGNQVCSEGIQIPAWLSRLSHVPSHRRHSLGDIFVYFCEGRVFDVEAPLQHGLYATVSEEYGDREMLKKKVGGKDGVVRLHNGGESALRRVYGGADLGQLVAVVDRYSTCKGRCEAGSGSSSQRMVKYYTL